MSFVGNGVRMLVERCLVAAAGEAVAEAQRDRALTLLVDHYGAHLLDSTRLYDGVADVLRRLRSAGVVLSVATNKHEAMARAILHGLGVGDLFAAILGGDSMPLHKPDPGIVFELVRRSGLASRDSLFIGDSTVDVATARAAGIPVCAVTWGFTRVDVLREAAPEYLIDRPDALLGLVGAQTL